MVFGLVGVSLLKGMGYLSSSPVLGCWPQSMEDWKISARRGQFLAEFLKKSAGNIIWYGCLVNLKMGQQLGHTRGAYVQGGYARVYRALEFRDRRQVLVSKNRLELFSHIFALSELSGKKSTIFLKGSNSRESLRVDFMYFQKGLVLRSSKALLIRP